MDSWVNGSKWDLLVCVNVVDGVFTKNCITGNAYARINCIISIDTVGKIWTIRVVWRKTPIK